MTRLFGRRARAIVTPAASVINSANPNSQSVLIDQDGVRFAFEFHKTIKGQNKGRVTLYNLNEKTRELVSKKEETLAASNFDNFAQAEDGTTVKVSPRLRLEAGYVDLIETVLLGDITDARTARAGPDRVTTLQIGDGIAVRKTSRTSTSMPAGTKMSDVVRQGVTDMKANGVGTKLVEIGADVELANGYSFSGKTEDMLDEAAEATGSEWSIQDGQLQMMAKNSAVNEAAIVLSEATGLIGEPVRTDFGYQVSSLLISGIRPGRLIQLISPSVASGAPVLLVPRTVRGRGDTRGTSEWGMTSECVILPTLAPVRSLRVLL